MKPEKGILVVLCGVLMLALVGGMAYAQSITVTSPSAGVTWYKGQTYNITWTSSDEVPDQVRIRLRDSASTTVILNITDAAPNSGVYSWTIPESIAPGNYRIRVRSLPGDIWGDSVVFSIAPFMIAPFRPEKVAVIPKSVQLKVCVTNGKGAPIHGNRDIHVWIKNIGGFNSPSTTLKFFIGGKGTTTHVVPELIPGGEFKQTRRHSWSTTGKRTITAEVLVPGGEPIRVNGSISIHTTKPRYQLEHNVMCSDGSHMKEADIFKDDPKPKDDPLLLTVCASDGKNPLINAKRDIHVWVRNPPHSGITYRNLLLEFHVEGKPTTHHHIESLAPGGKIQFTRNHSWGKATNKKIRATVFSPGRTHQVSVESSFKVSHPGRPTSSAELNVKCSDGSKKKESDI